MMLIVINIVQLLNKSPSQGTKEVQQLKEAEFQLCIQFLTLEKNACEAEIKIYLVTSSRKAYPMASLLLVHTTQRRLMERIQVFPSSYSIGH